MRCTHAGQAAVPPSTERARTLATRSGTAFVLVAALGRTRRRFTMCIKTARPSSCCLLTTH